jgi:hypothetical protein
MAANPNIPAVNRDTERTVIGSRTDAYRMDDEIELVDLWLVLMRRKTVLFAVCAGVLALGALIAFSSPKKYRYSTTIEIGTIVEDGRTRPIESTETVQAKLVNSYIPLTLREYAEAHPDEPLAYNINADVPKRSLLLVVESTGPAESGAAYLQLHDTVVDKLVDDHKRTLNVVRAELEKELGQARLALEALEDPVTLEAEQKALETQLAKEVAELRALEDPRILAVQRKRLEATVTAAKDKLENLKDTATLLATRHKRLDETRRLLSEQAAELKAQIGEALDRRKRAATEATTETRAMTLLMIDNEIQQNRNRLAAVEERLYIDLANQQQQLEIELDANKREQVAQAENIAVTEATLEKWTAETAIARERQSARPAELKARIAKLQADRKREITEKEQLVAELQQRLENFRETRAVGSPMQSRSPVGLGMTKTLALSLVIGLVAGLLAAFLVELVSKTRAEAAAKLAREGTR